MVEQHPPAVCADGRRRGGRSGDVGGLEPDDLTRRRSSAERDPFGAFGLLLLTYITGVVRTLVSEPALVRTPWQAKWKGEMLGAGMVLGLSLGGLTALAAESRTRPG